MRAGWLTPDSLPTDLRTCTISFPDSEDFHSLVRGALFLLSDEKNFEEFGSLTPTEVSDAFRDMLFRFLEDDCMPVPVGATMDFWGSVIPDGWLNVNSGPVSRTTYARLFAVIGEQFGPGDGSTTFDLPPIAGRVRVGLKSGDTEFGVLGGYGGSKTHTLTVAEMPSHTHTQDPHNHLWSDGVKGAFGSADFSNSGTTLTKATDNTTAVNQAAGGGAAHGNIQPYIVSRVIIKF